MRNEPDTVCDPILCLEDEKVVNNVCLPCQPGAENEAGDDASLANTACEAILCDINEYVSANNCTPCAPLYVNLAGDDATSARTPRAYWDAWRTRGWKTTHVFHALSHMCIQH